MEHYFSKDSLTLSKRRTFGFDFRGEHFDFVSDNAVFSKNQADRGSLLMISEIIDFLSARGVKNGLFLDFAAGYGLIGVILKRFFPEMDIYFSEINRRALELCQINASAANIPKDHIIESDGIGNIGNIDFDYISLNPPIRTGKETVKRLILEAGSKLKDEDSYLFTVIGKKQGAESYAKFHATEFQSDRLTYDKGFEVRLSSKK